MKNFLILTVLGFGLNAFASQEVIELESESMEHACFITTIEATNQAISQGLQELYTQSTQACDHEHYNVTDIDVKTVRDNPGSCARIEVALKANCIKY